MQTGANARRVDFGGPNNGLRIAGAKRQRVLVAKAAKKPLHSAETRRCCPPSLCTRAIHAQHREGGMDMQSASVLTVSRAAPGTSAARQRDTVETQLWLDEHEWLHALLKSADNVSPTFRFPDLISACVTLALGEPGGAERIFGYLGKELVLRDPRTPRRREYLWREQFNLLRDLQLSDANRHPNPMFQLDQLTTACVALARRCEDAAARVLQHARLNMAKRTVRGPVPKPSG